MRVGRMRIVAMFAVLGFVMLFTQACSTLPRDTDLSSGGTLSAQTARAELTVKVVTSASGAEAETSAGRIQDMAEDALAGAGYRIDRNLPDMLLSLRVEAELWDQTGPYYLFKGDCNAEARRVYDDKLIGKGRFSARGERIQDEGDALVSLGEKLGGETARWLAAEATPAQLGVAAVDLAVEHSWYNFFKKQPEYVSDFIAAVGGVDGVLSCRLVGDDRQNKTRSFRVVYIEDKIPEGILNRIAAIEDLNIKIGK
jgi:hypothetical protein